MIFPHRYYQRLAERAIWRRAFVLLNDEIFRTDILDRRLFKRARTESFRWKSTLTERDTHA